MTIYYIADPHFGHEGAIRMNQRPFETVEEMDQSIMNNWNSTVKDEDEIYILGDFLYRASKSPEYYLDRLKGKKHLILGNHERWTNHFNLSNYFNSVAQIKEITDQSQHIILCHYPMAEWPRYYKGSLHVFGHIHNNRTGEAFQYYKRNPNMFNAGVDINHFIPVTLQQLKVNNALFKQG